MNKPLTGTALKKMRRSAKQQARTDAIPYGHALEQQARNAGFASWHEARKALRSIPSAPAGELPVDPPLPPQFDQTPNEQRSKAELDAWWLRPFAQSRGDGSYDVRCLDGGAWDRPTYYGVAKELDEAHAIARAGLERWKKMRDTPAFLLLDGAVLLALEPNRPGMPRPVLFTGGTTDDAKRFLEQFEKLRETKPGAAALIIRAARGRSSRVPTYDEVEAVSKRAAANGLVAPDGVLLISVQKVTVRASLESEDWRGVCSSSTRKCLSCLEFLLVSRSAAEGLFAWSISAASTRFRCSL